MCMRGGLVMAMAPSKRRGYGLGIAGGFVTGDRQLHQRARPITQ
jgi:hypothetical protein